MEARIAIELASANSLPMSARVMRQKLTSGLRALRGALVAVSAAALTFVGIGSVQPVRAATGAELFEKNCAACHGMDGRARTPAGRKLGAKDLSESKTTDAEIEKQITEGKKDNRGEQKMPAFKGTLAADDIKLLIPWVKKFRK